MTELKPCPFCGGKNIYIDGYNHSAGLRWRVMCLDCMATVDPGTIQQKYCAIAAWNRRAQPENAPLTLDELRQMDGEPVFAVDGEGHSAWVVVNAKDECCADNEFGSWAFSYYEMMMPTVLTESENKLHPMGWLAHRYKKGVADERF